MAIWQEDAIDIFVHCWRTRVNEFQGFFNLDILGWRFLCPFTHFVREASQPNSDSVQFQPVENWAFCMAACSK